MSIEITPKVGFDSVDYTKDTDTHLMLEVTGSESGLTRAPLNIVDVVDVSSSMAKARKLDHVKKSLVLKISHMSVGDYLTIIAYGSYAQVALPRTHMDASGKQKALQAVSALRAGGGTDYGQALGAVKQELSSSDNSFGFIRRVILFSDGCPTCGEQNDDNLINICKDTPDGWQLTTMGYGVQRDDLMKLANSSQMNTPLPGPGNLPNGYINIRGTSPQVRPDGMSGEVNIGLLTAMADAGRGNFYYMADADSASSAFATELGGLLSTVAQNIKIEVTAEKDRISVKEVLEDLDVNDKGDVLEITIPDIMSGETKYVTMPITCLKRSTEDNIRPARIANIKVVYLNPSNANTEKLEVVPRIQWVESGKESKTINPDVQTQVAVIEALKAQEQADQYASKGMFAQAVNTVNAAYENLMHVGTERAIGMAGPMGPQGGPIGAQGYQGAAAYAANMDVIKTSHQELKTGRSSGGAFKQTKGFSNKVQATMTASFKDDWDNVNVDPVIPVVGAADLGISQPVDVVDPSQTYVGGSTTVTTSRAKKSKVSRY